MWITVEAADGTVAAALPLAEGQTVVGSAGGCTVILAEVGVSRRHVVVERKGLAVTFRDEGSTTGTTHDGVVSVGGPWQVGETLGVGPVVLRLVDAPPAARQTRSLYVAPAALESNSPTDWSELGRFLANLRGAGEARELLARLLQGLLAALEAERGYVLLVAGSRGALTTVAAEGFQDPATFVSISSTVSRHALDTGQTVWIDDSQRHALTSQAQSVLLNRTSRSILCRALVADGTPYGVIYLDMPRRSVEPPRQRMALFEAVTGLAAELLAASATRSRLLAAERRIDDLRKRADEGERLVLGDDERAAELRGALEAAAAHDVTVLVTGETGTGKEMVARTLHGMSSRCHGPFVAVDCAALPRDLVEAELFGAVKGAFTGADTARPGRFVMADGGTLFLDEVGDVPQDVQVKLLRVLQERTVTPLGGTTAVPLDFRLVCATNVDLEAAVRDGAFRQDLFYRINVFRLPLRPLRERRGDIMPLARHFLDGLTRRFHKPLDGFTDEAERLLVEHSWPGNVRELRNAVERAVVVEKDRSIGPSSLPLSAGPVTGSGVGADGFDGLPDDYEAAHQAFDRRFLKRLLDRHGGNVTAAAQDAGLSRFAFYRRLAKAGLAVER